MRVLELFSGIGGLAAAVGDRVEIALAVDQDEWASRVYGLNFGHPAKRWNLAVTPAARLDVGADLWWASPPCQPFTVRGRSRDLDDPRAAPFVRMMSALEALRPWGFAMENVPGFAGSAAHAQLRAVLRAGGWHVHEAEWCPSTAGIRNVRRRFYLLATRDPVAAPTLPPLGSPPLRALLDADPDPALDADPTLVLRYGTNLPVVDADDPLAVTHCFTGAYGKSPVYSGSWLRDGERLRRFSPGEIARLLGFPGTFVLPPELDRRKAWKLVGNSLSVPVVRAWLAPALDASPTR